MIPRAHITAWRAQAPWPDDALVEQDLVLSRALVELYQHRVIADQFAFRGGTALNKLFFDPPARFSEDIDLVQLEAGPIGGAMDAIRDCLDGWLDGPSTKQGHGRVTLRYRFDSETAPAGRRRLKVEINTREHFNVLGMNEHSYLISNPWFGGRASLTVYTLEEPLGTKLRALFQRRKGRDLFDLWMALEHKNVDPAAIAHCFGVYIERQGRVISRAEFEQNLTAKLADAAFVDDIAPLIRPGLEYDVGAAAELVRGELIGRLP